jgi:hypothetical protein
LKVEVAKKADFEINEEEEDDDFAGPTLDLFHKPESASADLQENSNRQRKDGGILSKVKDVESDEDQVQTTPSGMRKLPISHEVMLEGHHKAI